MRLMFKQVSTNVSMTPSLKKSSSSPVSVFSCLCAALTAMIKPRYTQCIRLGSEVPMNRDVFARNDMFCLRNMKSVYGWLNSRLMWINHSNIHALSQWLLRV